MKLEVGDKIVCYKPIGELTLGKTYKVVHTRGESTFMEAIHGDDMSDGDICIHDDHGINWWFGQIGSFEPWTMWFVTEDQWRERKIEMIENEE